MDKKPCIDCEPGSKRPTPHPGPRCATHHRGVIAVRKKAAHDKMVQKVYGLEPGDYDRLYEGQGGRCAIAGCRATGRVKRLAVDHDHSTGLPRGLLCGPHNQVIGYNRDNPDAFRSLADYLENPPARSILAWLADDAVSSDIEL